MNRLIVYFFIFFKSRVKISQSFGVVTFFLVLRIYYWNAVYLLSIQYTFPNCPKLLLNTWRSSAESPHLPPYLIPSDQCGKCFAVTIQGAEYFKGFFIQARDVATNQWIGEWVETPNTKRHPECSAITHADPREKQQATLLWQAPQTGHGGKVYFT